MKRIVFFDIANITASHVRVVGLGNSVDSSIALTEVRVRGSERGR